MNIPAARMVLDFYSGLFSAKPAGLSAGFFGVFRGTNRACYQFKQWGLFAL